jgi:hypothetical protein
MAIVVIDEDAKDILELLWRRCQRSRVVGVITKDRQCARGRRRLAAAKNSRSIVVIAGRLVC